MLSQSLRLPQSELPDWNLAPRQVSEPRVGRDMPRGPIAPHGAGEGCRLGGGASSYLPMLDFHRTRGSHPGTAITPPPLQICHNLLTLPSGQIRCFCLSHSCSVFTTRSGCFQGGHQPSPKMCRMGVCRKQQLPWGNNSKEEKNCALLHKMAQGRSSHSTEPLYKTRYSKLR